MGTHSSIGDPRLPRNAWYPVAASQDVGRTPVAGRLLDLPIVLYRSTAGVAVGLEDRCAHRPVRLSRGHLEGDILRSHYTGFGYDLTGRCVAVPSQVNVPYATAVRAYPVRDDGSFIWVWPGETGLSELRAAPDTGLLRSELWSHFGGSVNVAAGLGLLHENFCDITHVEHLDRSIAPPALEHGPALPLEVEVSETSVRFVRQFAAAPLPRWNYEVLDLPADAMHGQVEESIFAGPGLLVDRWTVNVVGHDDRDGQHTLVFTHALSPTSTTQTRHLWRVSRNFGHTPATEAALRPQFETYYQRVAQVLEEMQHILTTEGARPEVSVTTDVAWSHVQRIMRRMVVDETGTL